MAPERPLGLYVFNREEDTTHVTLKSHLTICTNYITHHPKKLVGIPYSSSSDKIGHAFAHLWQSIIEIYTIFALKRENCVSEKFSPNFDRVLPLSYDLSVEPMIHFDETPLYYPATVENKVSTLRFVSCGKRGVSLFPFGELVSTFDVYIWTCIGLTIVALTKVHIWLLKFMKISMNKIFLECLALLFE